MCNDGGSWRPFNLDNTAHECRDRDKSTQQTQTQQQSKKQITLEEIQARLERIEQTLYGNK